MYEETVCRLCFKKMTLEISIFQNEIIEMLESLTSIKVNKDDKTSTHICPKCFVDLKQAYTIQQRMIKAEQPHEQELLTTFLIDNHEEIITGIKQHELKNLKVDKINTVQNIGIEKSVQELSHVESPRFECEACSEKFQHSIDFRKHIEHHAENPDPDESVQQIEEDMTLLNIDENTSKNCVVINESNMLCEYCGDIFCDSESYNLHLKEIHTGQYVCGICGKDFFTRDDLQQHSKSKHMKQFICDICNEAFMLRYILHLHRVQHFKTYPFNCEFCGRKFKYNITLTVHQKTKHPR